MWWFAIPIVAIGLKVVYDVVSDGERQARREWEDKREKVKRTIKSHKEDIQKHIRKAQKCYDFCQLVDLHHSSVLIANEAYKLLKDSNESLSAMIKMLDESKKQINKLKKKKQKILESLNSEKNTTKHILPPHDYVELAMYRVWTSVTNNSKKTRLQHLEKVKTINKDISLNYDFRKSIIQDFEKVKKQRNNFLLQVRELNNKTHQLKECIRDNCGNGGKAWYARLENRSQS